MAIKNKFISTILLIVFFVSCIPVYANSTFSFFIEAENCTITSRLRIGNDSAASGSRLVDLMCTVGDEISFEVTVPESGIYTVNMRYANAYNNAPATASLYINGEKYKQIMVENTKSWNTYAISVFTMELAKGKNKIAIRYDSGDTGNFNFDYFEILSGDLTEAIKKEDHLSYPSHVAKLLNDGAEFKAIATDHKILSLLSNGEASFNVQAKYDGVYELKIHYVNKNKNDANVNISSNGALLTTVSAQPTISMKDFSDVVTVISLRKGINPLVFKNTSQAPIEISGIELNYIKELQYSEYEFLYKDMQDNKLQHIISLLDNLGIMKSFSDNTFRPDLGVTRAEFVEMAVKMAYGTEITGQPTQVFKDVPNGHWASRYINLAVDSGLIEKGENFRPNEPMKAMEAVMILVRATGHDYFINNNDNIEQYLNIAYSQKIISDYNLVKDAVVSRKMAAILLYNTLNAKLFKPVSYGDEVQYKLFDSETLLNTIHKVRRVTGVVYASDLIKLVGVALKEDEILLGNEIFKIGNTRANEFVGYEVEAFVKSFASDDHERVISIGKLDNTKLKISAMDILSKTTTDKLFYFDRKANEEKKINIASGCIILYNQMIIQNVSVSDFMPTNGFIEVIDNKNDSYADVLLIHDLKTYIASDACLSGNKFIIKDLKGKQPRRTIDLDNKEKKVLFYENGVRCKPKAVTTGNVIEIGESANYVEIYVSTYTSSGIVTEINQSEDSIVVNGNEYRAVKGYFSITDVSVGDEVLLRLNSVDEIADIAIIRDNNKHHYGFITKLSKINGIRDSIQVKMFTKNSEWKVFELADKLRINGIMKDKEDIFTVSGLFNDKFEASDITLSGSGVWLDSGRDEGFSGRDSIRGWDPISQNIGSSLEIRVDIHSAGFYRVETRYTTPDDAKRQLYVDGKPVGYINMPKTGGWFSDTLRISEDSPSVYLSSGEHFIRLVLEDTTQGGVDIDYIAVKNQNGSYVTHMVPQLISYGMNAENQINRIDIAVDYNPWIKDAYNDEIVKNNLFRVTNVSEYYSAGTSSFRTKVYLSDGKRIKFLIPNDISNEKAFQVVDATFGHDIWYNLKCYNVDQYGGNCSLIVEKYDSNRNLAEGKLYIVDSMGQKINSDGETVTTITVFSGKTKEVLECDSYYTPMNFPKGSVIQAYFTNNLLSNALLIFNGKKEEITYDISNPYQSNSIIKGKIEAVSADKKMVTISGGSQDIDASGNPKVININISNAQVGLYHTSSKRITSGDASDILIGDIVLIGTRYQVPLSMVVIKE